MKLLIFLCAMVISATGWCASSISPNNAHRVVTSSYRSASAPRPEASIRSKDDQMRISLIVCGMAAYVIGLVSWAVSAKGSLDRVLKHVIQSMARY